MAEPSVTTNHIEIEVLKEKFKAVEKSVNLVLVVSGSNLIGILITILTLILRS